MVKISAFSDEVTDDFAGQIAFLASQQIRFMEIRFVNGKNIMELNKQELKEAKRMLDDQGIGVSAIGSPIGKVRLGGSPEDHLDRFKQAMELADFFASTMIRVFSYYAPEGQNIDDYREEVMVRMSRKAALLKGSSVVMVHENEAHIYGHSAPNCVDLVKTIDSPHLKLAYDPANFVWGEHIIHNVETCWPLMQPYVVHVHIKDWTLGSPDVGSLPGEGDGQIRALLQALADSGYRGYLTMEPHLKTGGQFGGQTGSSLFAAATKATLQLCQEVGLEVA